MPSGRDLSSVENCVGTNEIFGQRIKRKIDSSSGEMEAGDDADGGQRKISNQLIPKSTVDKADI